VGIFDKNNEPIGARLQAFSLDMTKEKISKSLGQRFVPVLGETVIGSHIAMFGSIPADELSILKKIELDEGLPHLEFEGQWSKEFPKDMRSKLVVGWHNDNIRQLIDYAKQCNIRVIKRKGLFKNWGHFDINPSFVNGLASVKQCVDIAAKEGIYLGAHLRTFISTNDAYATPEADPRLATVGDTVLTI